MAIVKANAYGHGAVPVSKALTSQVDAYGVFVSFAPYDEPEIAVCVVGEYAGSGGSVAPVAVAIYDQYFGLNQTADADTGEF